MLIFESFFVVLGAGLLAGSFWLFKHYTHMPNVKVPKRLSARSLDTFQFYLARDSATNLLLLPSCPPTHPIYIQAVKSVYSMPQLTFEQIRYIRDLQYTFELALSAYMEACFNEETHRLAAKFMEDMQVLASEMYAVARNLSLTMQVRFPRECDDPMLTANLIKAKPLDFVRKRNRKGHERSSPQDALIDFTGASLG